MWSKYHPYLSFVTPHRCWTLNQASTITWEIIQLLLKEPTATYGETLDPGREWRSYRDSNKDAPLTAVAKYHPQSIIGHNSLVLDMELCRHYKMGDYSAAPQGTYSNFWRSSRPRFRLADLQEQQQVFHYGWSIFPNGKQNWQFFPLLSSLLTCLSMYSIPTLHRMTYSFKNKVVLVAMHC